MLSWFTKRLKRVDTAAAVVVAVGKVPSSPDFIHFGPPHTASAELEAWLASAVNWSVSHRSDSWVEAFDRGRPQAFVLRTSQTGVVFAGMLQPSQDAVGRRFPVGITAVLPSCPVNATHLMPSAAGGFVNLAHNALASMGQNISLDAAIANLTPPDLSRVDNTLNEYALWCAREPVGPLLKGPPIYRSSRSTAAASRAPSLLRLEIPQYSGAFAP